MHVRLATSALLLLATTAALGAEKAKPPADFPDAPPSAPPLRPAKLPPVFSTKLANGLEVVVISNDEIPWVSANLYVLTGAKADPEGKGGLAKTTAELLRQGTQAHTANELSALLDRHAIAWVANAGQETTLVRIGALTQYLDLGLQLMAEAVRSPVFEEAEFRRHIQQKLTQLAVAEKDGAYLAEREFTRRIYGEHYLSRPTEGLPATIRKIERDDLIAFHKSCYVPNNAMIVFSGAVSNEQAVKLARKHFGEWKRGTAPSIKPGKIPTLERTTIFLVDKPDATQTQIRMGQIGFRRTDPEFVPAQVFNQIFGGGFSSRLMRRVRIEEGLTYGARGGFSATKEPGRLSMSTFTRGEETAKTIRVLLDEVRKIRTDAPNEEEMSDAQSYIVGRFGLSLETPDDVAGKVFDLKFYGLAEDYYDTYLGQINRVAPRDVTTLAKRRIDSNRFAIVLVGNAAGFEKDLADIAPVVKVSIAKGGDAATSKPAAAARPK